MTEPTQEQIGQENAAAVFVLSTVPIESGPDYWKLHNRIATALARRALEARDEALLEALAIVLDTSSPKAAAAAIRALRGAR